MRCVFAARQMVLMVPLAVVGCQKAWVYHAYAPHPVEAQGVQFSVREVHRGRSGGVMVVEVTNHSPNAIACLGGADVWLQRDNGTAMRALSAQEFDNWVCRVGPKAMGFKHWPPRNVGWRLDAWGQGTPLPSGMQTTLAVGFILPRDEDHLTIALQPAVRWSAPVDALVQPASHQASPTTTTSPSASTAGSIPGQVQGGHPAPPQLPTIRVTLPAVPKGPTLDEISEQVDIGLSVGGQF